MIDPLAPDYQNTPVSPQRPIYYYRLLYPEAPPHVSIITPFYNAGEIFHETARSILASSFQQWEWLIINDGSDQAESLAILDGYRRADPRLHVIDHPKNLGLGAARNTGFRHARTDFIIQIDADDLIETTAIEKWYWGALSHPEFSFIKGLSIGFGAQEYLWGLGFKDAPLFLTENPTNATSLIRRLVHQAVGGYREEKQGGLEDWDFWLNCAAQGYWGGNIPEYTDWYRIRPDHRQRWEDWNEGRIAEFIAEARQRYSGLFERGFPQFPPEEYQPLKDIDLSVPCENLLHKKKKRLLIVVPWLQMGGVERYNLELVQHLPKFDWEISLVATLPGDQSWAPRFEAYTPDIFILSNFLRVQDYPRFLHYLTRSRRFDAGLISNSLYGFDALPFLRSVAPETSWVSLCHMEWEDGSFGGFPEQALRQRDYLDLNITSTNHLREAMISRGLDESRIEVCYTNIAPEQWQVSESLRGDVRQELSIPQEACVILYAARLSQQKQPDVFVNTLNRLKETGAQFHAIVVGEGPEEANLKGWIVSAGLDKLVHMVGAKPVDQMPRFFAAADIFYLPSRWEGIALVLYEAMAAGLPVVGADVGGQKELVTSETGFLIERSTPENEAIEYAEILHRLICDKNMRLRLGEAACRRVTQHFHQDDMLQRFDALLNEAIGFRKEHPLAPVSLAEAQASALQASETARLMRQSQATSTIPTEPEYSYDPLVEETPVYRGLKIRFMPVYQLATRRGWRFVVPLKTALRRVLNRK